MYERVDSSHLRKQHAESRATSADSQNMRSARSGHGSVRGGEPRRAHSVDARRGGAVAGKLRGHAVLVERKGTFRPPPARRGPLGRLAEAVGVAGVERRRLPPASERVRAAESWQERRRRMEALREREALEASLLQAASAAAAAPRGPTAASREVPRLPFLSGLFVRGRFRDQCAEVPRSERVGVPGHVCCTDYRLHVSLLLCRCRLVSQLLGMVLVPQSGRHRCRRLGRPPR